MAYLIVEQPDARPKKVNLAGTTTIGRAREAGIWVPDMRLSREHCRIDQRPDGWFLVDLGSSNGTRIDDKPIRDVRLENNVRVNVGDTWLTFREGTLIQRPENPVPPQISSSAASAAADLGSTLTGTNFATRVLPPVPVAEEHVEATPLAFTRPPATPIVPVQKSVEPGEGSNWFRSLIGRLIKS